MRPLRSLQVRKPYGSLGDTLSLGERNTWRVMTLYRRWSVFCALQLLTVLWWTHPSWFPGGLPGWNYVWSDLAVVVEMVVGISFLGQAIRDGAVIRKELAELRCEIVLLRRIAGALHVDVSDVEESS